MSNLMSLSFKMFLVAMLGVFGLMFVAAALSGQGVDGISLHQVLEMAASF